MTHKAEGMDISQLVASSSATVLLFLFPFVVDSVLYGASKMLLCPSSYPYLISARGTTQGALIDQQPYMATQENFITLFS